MSNLGLYQTMTTMAKLVGGPLNLAICVAGGGVVTGGGVVAAYFLIKEKINAKREERQQEAAIVYTVQREGQSNEGLVFKVGDQFRVLFIHDDAVMIEKLGDNNNPYVVSAELLETISDYRTK